MSFIWFMMVFQVVDVDCLVGFYEWFGFVNYGIWQYDGIVQFVIVQCGDVIIVFQYMVGVVLVNSDWVVYIYVLDFEVLYVEFVCGGIEVIDINWFDYYGCDDFDVVDLDRYCLVFGQVYDLLLGFGLFENRGFG